MLKVEASKCSKLECQSIITALVHYTYPRQNKFGRSGRIDGKCMRNEHTASILHGKMLAEAPQPVVGYQLSANEVKKHLRKHRIHINSCNAYMGYIAGFMRLHL